MVESGGGSTWRSAWGMRNVSKGGLRASGHWEFRVSVSCQHVESPWT